MRTRVAVAAAAASAAAMSIKRHKETTLLTIGTDGGILSVRERGARRSLMLGSNCQGVIGIDSCGQPTNIHVEEWTQVIHACADCWLQPLDRPKALFLGLGAGIVPRSLLALNSTLSVLCVELFPEVVAAAVSHFGVQLSEAARCSAHAEDAGKFLVNRRAGESGDGYDLIVVDMFDGDGLAASLTDGHMLRHLPSSLSGRGLVIINTTWGLDATARAATAHRLAHELTDSFDAVYTVEVCNCRNVLVLCHQGEPKDAEAWRRLLSTSLPRSVCVCPDVSLEACLPQAVVRVESGSSRSTAPLDL